MCVARVHPFVGGRGSIGWGKHTTLPTITTDGELFKGPVVRVVATKVNC